VEVKTRKPYIVETWALAYGGNRLGDGFLIKLNCASFKGIRATFRTSMKRNLCKCD
jgi:hypothetical protein